MNQKTNKIIVLLFALFLGGIALGSFILPDKAFSEMENRNLQLFPDFTWSKWKSGYYMKEMEDYISDHTVLRDQWVGLKAFTELLTGKKENNGVYFGEDGTLIKKVVLEDEDFKEKIDCLHGLVQNTEVPVYFGLVPTAAQIWKDKLPEGAPTLDEKQWINHIYNNVNVPGIDFISELEEQKDQPIYYKTDHHWTSLGAFYGANAILKELGREPLELKDYEKKTVTEEFCGTTYSSGGAWWVEPDEISIYVDETDKTVTSNFTGKDVEGKLYHYDRLDTKNKYAFFLGGNQPKCLVQSKENKDSILLIRDSYADSLVPFLSESFGEIHLFDLRYNRLSIKEYVKEHDIDQILVLYSFSNYIEDENQFLLDH